MRGVELAEPASKLKELLSLKGEPVALALLNEELGGALRARDLGVKVLRLCQMAMLSRTHRWMVEAGVEDLAYMCSYVLGLRDDLPSRLAEDYAEYWFRDVDDGLRKLKEMYRAPRRGQRFVATAPLSKASFKPSALLIYLNPAQACLALCALQWSHYRRLTFTFTGESACSDSIARCLATGEASLTVPCFGERRFGHVQDDELLLAISPGMLEGLVEGLRALRRRGVVYPIPFAGPQLDLTKALPERYRRLYEA